tara:strand:- start:593 stop:1111 length:519 start_codon:yes stop_codon:yes gene_type:complete
VKLLLENWRKYLGEIIQGGVHDPDRNTYTKTMPPSSAGERKKEIQLYKDAIGKEIRGVAKVYNVKDNEDGSVTVEMEHILPYDNSKGAYGEAIREPRYQALRCIGTGRSCVDERGKLNDEEYEMALEFHKDIKSAAKYFRVSGSKMDDNPGNYGFAERNGRLELVFLDFGHG